MPQLIYGHEVINGVKIHYYRTGDEKPPLVFLHGVTDNGLCWGRVALYFEVDNDVVLIDARGHGLSDAPESGYTSEIMASDTAGLIEKLRLQRPILIGHSMGAATAAAVAALYPNLVGGLVLEDPPWIDGPDDLPEQKAEQARQRREHILSNKTKSVDELIDMGQREHNNWDIADIDQWAKSKQEVSPHIAAGMTEPRRPWREYASRITCPTLLITGDPELGALVRPETAQEAARLVRKLKVINIPEAGHSIRRDQFRPYLDALRQFIKEARPRR